jgi:DNA repair photolyase
MIKKVQKLVKRKEITSGTREWADRNINCIKGCTNNCRYCYAKLIAKRFGRCSDNSWPEIEINQNIINKQFKKYPGRVMFPSSHDIIDTPQAKEACYVVLEKLLKAENNVLVTTKPKYIIVKEIIDLFLKFRTQIQFRFTITSLDNDLLSFWEPNAPCFEDRLKSLIYAYEQNFKTSVSIEPFLDSYPEILVKTVSPYVTESIWLGPMNYIPINNIAENNKLQYMQIREKYKVARLFEIFENLKEFPKLRFKDSMFIRLNIPYRNDIVSN